MKEAAKKNERSFRSASIDNVEDLRGYNIPCEVRNALNQLEEFPEKAGEIQQRFIGFASVSENWIKALRVFVRNLEGYDKFFTRTGEVCAKQYKIYLKKYTEENDTWIRKDNESGVYYAIDLLSIPSEKYHSSMKKVTLDVWRVENGFIQIDMSDLLESYNWLRMLKANLDSVVLKAEELIDA